MHFCAHLERISLMHPPPPPPVHIPVKILPLSRELKESEPELLIVMIPEFVGSVVLSNTLSWSVIRGNN